MVVSIAWWTEFSLKKWLENHPTFINIWLFLVPSSRIYLWEDSFFQVICYINVQPEILFISIPTEHPPKTPIRKRHVFLCRPEGCIVAQQIGSPNEASKRQPLSRKKKGAFCCCEMGHGKSFASAKRRSFPISARMRRTNPKRVFLVKQVVKLFEVKKLRKATKNYPPVQETEAGNMAHKKPGHDMSGHFWTCQVRW